MRVVILSDMTRASSNEQRQRLSTFRAGFHRCLTRWGDALFELCDAALCTGGPVASVPSLSLEPEFRRSHGSLYKGLVRGRLDEERFKDLLVEHRPTGWPEIFAVDASTWDRCDAECSPERGFYYSASKHSAGQPIVAGWSYQWIAQLDFSADSWTAPLDARRIHPDEDATTATIEQVQELVERLGTPAAVPMFVFDAGYDPIALDRRAGPNPRPGAGAHPGRPRLLPRSIATRAKDAAVGPGATADASSFPRRARWAAPTPSLPPPIPVTARCGSGPGTACTRGSSDAVVGRATTHRPSCAAVCCASTSNTCLGPMAGPKRPCGCGGEATASLTSTCASGPICVASTSSTPTASRRTHSGGRHRVCAHLNRPIVGHGSSSPR